MLKLDILHTDKGDVCTITFGYYRFVNILVPPQASLKERGKAINKARKAIVKDIIHHSRTMV